MVLYKTVASYGEIWLGRLAIATTLQNWKRKHCSLVVGLEPRFVLWVNLTKVCLMGKFCGHNYPSIPDPGEWRETQHN
jgi:hypothetical protein